MRRLACAVCVAVLALPAGAADDNGFAETAPPKVRLPLDSEAAPEAQAPEAAPETPGDPLMEAVRSRMGEAENAAEPQADPEGAEAEGDREFSPGMAILRGIMGLGGALALYLLGVAAVRRWGKRSPLLAGQQFGRVMGRIGLSPQASLHYVRTNDEVLVVGVTQQSVSLLRTYDAADFDTALESGEPAATPPDRPQAHRFLDQLKDVQENNAARPGVDEELDTLKGDLQRLKQYFQDSARGRE